MKSSVSKSVFRVFATLAIFLVSISSAFAQKADTIAIIDAGSSGSRLFVYCIKDNNVTKIYPQKEDESNSKGKALSKVPIIPDSVKAFVNDMTSKYQHSNMIPLYILATAGMRLEDKDKANSVYSYMTGEHNKFIIKKAMTISGKYEGLYAWIATYHQRASDALNGIVEFGGASMQLTFQIPATAKYRYKENDIIFRAGIGYLYSKSFLRGGVDQVYTNPENAQTIKTEIDPIIPKDLNVSFLGLGKPIGIILNGITDKGSIDDYIGSLEEDTPENYHPKSNAIYIKTLFDTTFLSRLKKSEYDISWTEGAAIDIFINKMEPESFDYSNPN